MRAAAVVCTHNPRADHLAAVVRGLQAQTRPFDEVLIVDNASARPVQAPYDVRREERLGLVHARKAGIANTTAELIVFVDDDNVLAPDYAEVAIDIAERAPGLGAFGAGRIIGQYETPPPPEVAPYVEYLAIRDVGRSAVACEKFPFGWHAVPYGAGMCVRREVAEDYASALSGSRERLGVQGQSLMRCDDIDLVYTASDRGLSFGVFPELQLTHLIPPERLTRSYLLQVIEGHERSMKVLMRIRDVPTRSRRRQLLHDLRRLPRLRGMERAVYLAERRGRMARV
jgi:glycosyltransferase involved in cell wall biosynthesis